MTDYISEFEKGYEAFQRKDYRATLSIWEPLVKKNISWAIQNVAVMYAKGYGVEQNADNNLHSQKLFSMVGQEIHDMEAIEIPSGGVMVYLNMADPRKKIAT